MWKEKYRKALAKASTRLADLLTRDLEEVFEVGRQLDVEIRDVVVEIGRQTEEKMLAIAYEALEKEAKERGLTPQRRDEIHAEGVLGTISVESPYLYDRDTGESARPLHDHLGIAGNTYSDALDRAISDFGAHTSHQDAAQKCPQKPLKKDRLGRHSASLEMIHLAKFLYFNIIEVPGTVQLA